VLYTAKLDVEYNWAGDRGIAGLLPKLALSGGRQDRGKVRFNADMVTNQEINGDIFSLMAMLAELMRYIPKRRVHK